MKSVAPSFAIAFVRITAHHYLAEDGLDPLGRETFRTYASIIRRHNFKYHVSFNAVFEHDFTDAHESHQTLSLNDIHINLGQKQSTPPGCINNINFKPDFLGKMGEIQLNVFGWRYLGTRSMDVKFSKLDIIDGTSYVELPIDHRSIINVKNAKDIFCAIWCMLALLYPPKANVSLTSSYVQHFITMIINGINFHNGLLIKDISKFEKLNSLSIHVFELDDEKLASQET